jgi:NhaP-type Na+/H+ or K+/H+ antiporter
MSFASELGLSAGDPYFIGLFGAGLAFLVAITALSYQSERAFSAAIIYLGLGLLAGVGLYVLGIEPLDPVGDAELISRVAELALLVAVFTAGLKMERRLTFKSWRSVVLLIALVMPATVALIVAFGTLVMGLSLGAALILGGVLAATDPVLAGDIGVGAPGDQPEDSEEPQFAITAEAGLNDGLAAPLVLLGILVAGGASAGEVVEWAFVDLLYAVVVAAVVGAAGGYGLAALVVPLRKRELFLPQFDGFVSIAAPLLLYGATEAIGAYGLVAGFAGGLAFRRYEFGHEYNRRMHDGAEVVEKLLELTVILVLGSMVTLSALDEPGVAGWLLVPALLLVFRPGSVLLFFSYGPLTFRGCAFVAWFGVRGVAAVYFSTAAVQTGVLASDELSTVVWTALVCVMASIVVHGVTSGPVTRRLGYEARD